MHIDKRQGKYKWLLRKLVAGVLFVLLCGFLSGCGESYYMVDDWETYVQNLHIYSFTHVELPDEEPSEVPEEPNEETPDTPENPDVPDTPDTPDQPDQPDQPDEPDPVVSYAGLREMSGYFAYSTDFFGDYAYVETDEGGFLFNQMGELLKIDENHSIFNSTMSDIIIHSMQDSVLIYQRDGLYGIADVGGNLLGDCRYIEIVRHGTVFAAKTEKATDIYFDGSLQYTLPDTNAALLSTDCLLIAGKSFDVRTREPLYAGGYRVVYPISDGMQLVYNERTGRYGYVAVNEIFSDISPSYFIAGDFYGGVACVYEFDASRWDENVFFGYPKLINRKGETVFDFYTLRDRYKQESLHIFFRQDGYVLYEGEYRGAIEYGIIAFDDLCLEGSGESILLPINRPYENRVYGEYVIDEAIARLYSIKDGCYVSEAAEKILPFDDCFILQHAAENYSLIDGNLADIISAAKSLTAAHGVLRVLTENGTAFYTKA